MVLPYVLACHVDQPPRPPPNPNIVALSQASNEFFQRLYLRLNKGQESLVLSPTSIHLIMSLTAYGARGPTKSEMEHALNLNRVNGQPGNIYQQLIREWESVGNVELLLANALYLDPSLQIKPDFKHMAEACYNASVENIDRSSPEGPEKAINDYIAEQTKDNIQDMLPPGSLGDDTQLLEINTLFFNGTWHEQFDPNRTRKAEFTKMDGSKIQVDMMEDVRRVLYKDDIQTSAQIIELQFKNEGFGLYIAVPKNNRDTGLLETMLQSPQVQDDLFENLACQEMRVQIPKFRIESPFVLDDALRQVGIQQAFDSRAADLSGIADGNLYISRVQQKAVIDVQETGTVAAAATISHITSASVGTPVPEFKADRTFMFFLYDRQTKQVMYQGRYNG